MPQVINITLEEIQRAERILLPQDKTFDDERITFIQNLDTIDLQAVPGSGKTTALLAKLLILEKKLPFNDGSGILVISHTNAAIDEIKQKIKKYCPNLFNYPNFVGTIQSFVDEFLAIPYYANLFKKRLIRIDNDIYEEYASKFSRLFFQGFTQQEQNNAKRYLRSNDLFKSLRFTHINNEINLTKYLDGSVLRYSKPQGNTRPENYIDWIDSEKIRIKEWLTKFKFNLLDLGVLCYDDAYFLAREYLLKKPNIKTILQSRFKYIFADEMQDMENHQYKLLEQIFWDEGNSISKYQRIGDKNQAIFGGGADLEDIWFDRDAVLEFNGSQRLNSKIANILKPFAIRPIEINGLEKNQDGTEIDIKPTIIIYNDTNITTVISKFSEIIQMLIQDGKMPLDRSSGYKAICWTTIGEPNKIRLDSYFPNFSKEAHKPKTDYNSLDFYLTIFEKESKTLEKINKNILHAILKILRIENILDDNNRNYTRQKLINYLKQKHTSEYEDFKLKMYNWCINIIRHKKNEVLEEIKNYIPILLTLLRNRTITSSKEFIDNQYTGPLILENNINQNSNKYTNGDVSIDISTVHSVKGQTHTATLYLESHYDRGGGGSYESERLNKQLKGVQMDANMHDKAKKAAKMVYVGFSRPTHLLCFAVHECRFDSHLSDIDTNIWKIVRI